MRILELCFRTRPGGWRKIMSVRWVSTDDESETAISWSAVSRLLLLVLQWCWVYYHCKLYFTRVMFTVNSCD